ncbi:MAG: Rrf2 family transcriptional regulator [Candidatus Omnitrophica bacterium]|nr:Rrf2 family transcriptional regulator [Candidatus Omnitrophota bacterium]
MKLSTRSTYGMRALVELALAAGRGPVSAAAIAKRQDLSVAYLEQLLHRLKKRRLVTSIRGPRGGYVLAKEPERITMAEVVLILDGGNGTAGPNGRAATAARAKGSSKEAHRHAQRIAQVVGRCVLERLTQSLGTITLQDLCDEVRAQAGEPLDHRYVFHI